MENKDIYQLIDKFEASSLTAFEIEQAGTRICMKKGGEQMVAPVIQQVEQPGASVEKKTVVSTPEKKITEIKAPLVGLFYTTPSPDAEPYVKVGDKIEKGQVLCILEAMKMMNELKSPVSGIVKNVLPQHGSPVEFDQVLFEVEEC